MATHLCARALARFAVICPHSQRFLRLTAPFGRPPLAPPDLVFLAKLAARRIAESSAGGLGIGLP
jgi:hypothetical protein